MKRTIFLLPVLMSLAASAQEVKPSSKFGLDLQQHLHQNVYHSNVLTRGAAPKVKVLVSLVPTAGVISADLEAVGCEVKWAMKSVASVIVGVDQLEALAAVPGVRNIDLPGKFELHNNKARKVVHVDEVSDPTSAVAAGLPKEYDGSGVLLGIIDTGIDFKHQAFRDEEGNTRFEKVFLQREDSIYKIRVDSVYDPNLGGMDYKTEDSISYKLNVTLSDPDAILNADVYTGASHGSHVLGIMTGRELGNNLHGMAPKAHIVAADIMNVHQIDDLIESMKLLCEYADEAKKPIAINMSVGDNVGFTDGCYPASEAMIELTDNGTKPGVIFSLSSGNEAEHKSWVNHKFTSDNEKLFAICDTIPTLDINPLLGYKVRSLNKVERVYAWVDRVVDNWDEMLVVFDRDKKIVVDDPDAEIGIGTLIPTVENGDTTYHFIGKLTTNDDPVRKVITLRQLREMLKEAGLFLHSIHTCTDGVTQKSEIRFAIDTNQLKLFQNLLLGVSFAYPAGTEVRVASHTNDKYGTFIKPDGFDNVTAGSADGSINIFACNAANITTGAYCIEDTCINIFGDIQVDKLGKVNDVHCYSSYGYTQNEEHLAKPEVLAPGGLTQSVMNGHYFLFSPDKYGVLSDKYDYVKDPAAAKSLSDSVRIDGQNYWYFYDQGTSMAAPVTTGIIALWLQANPNLSVADVREIIAHTSTAFVSPNKAYDRLMSSEYGIINALEGLKYIQANMTSISTLSQDDQNDGDALIFTLDGKVVKGTPAPGFYVQGGKKVVITK